MQESHNGVRDLRWERPPPPSLHIRGVRTPTPSPRTPLWPTTEVLSVSIISVSIISAASLPALLKWMFLTITTNSVSQPWQRTLTGNQTRRSSKIGERARERKGVCVLSCGIHIKEKKPLY
ncbi:hypothetical protein BDF14DRAFT_1823455 [Spinellus fusiger]|nr:hypothetical protein BDF14DRAFT_1823358 [Spinellus fusiger]KAI7865592.1 hypothetical protein BDF14DRAFT_1823455 [Spinellus fusiger]